MGWSVVITDSIDCKLAGSGAEFSGTAISKGFGVVVTAMARPPHGES